MAIEHSKADIVVLAGYMKKLGPRTLSAFAGRSFNTHPSLLPAFGGQGLFGMNVHRAVLAAGTTTSGASVHVVDADYDTGPVVARQVVSVYGTDSASNPRERQMLLERAK